MCHPCFSLWNIVRLSNIVETTSRRQLIVLIALACFTLCGPHSAAGTRPPDGAYPNMNTAEGKNALASVTSGAEDTAIGFQALFANTTGTANTAAGANALSSNTTGFGNTAVGREALTKNTTALGNTACGYTALGSNSTGNQNTAVGSAALIANTMGSQNVAAGAGAMDFNTTGNANVAIGPDALYFNTAGSNNIAIGYDVLARNSTAQNNTAIGFQALSSNTSGNNNIALGYSAAGNLTAGDNNIDIGNSGVANESGTIRIGTPGTQQSTFIAGIYGVTIPSGAEIRIDGMGHVGTRTCSARFKRDIKSMDKLSEVILKLKPVTFQYKEEVDPDATRQFGLVAEDVEKISPDLIVRDAEGKPYTVRDDAVNAMLLNEFLKEHRKVEEQATTIAEMQKQVANLTAMVQKVNEQTALRNSSSITLASH